MKRLSVVLAVITALALAAMVWRAAHGQPRSASQPASRDRDISIETPSPERIAGNEPTDTNTPTAHPADASRDPKTQQYLSRLLSVGRARGQISRPVLDDFVASTDRRATALLVAWREIDDRAYLEEAAANFPDDPRVLFAMITDSKSAAERDQWIEAFQKSAPDNPLADYFRAILNFEQKDNGAAFQALAEASGKTAFEDYMWDFSDEMEALYLHAGMPPAEAKATASISILLPHLQMLRELANQIGESQLAERSAGNTSRANDLLAAQMELGRTLAETPNRTLIHRLVGIAIQRNAIESSEPTAIDALFGRPPPALLAELQTVREQIVQTTRTADLASLIRTEADLLHYFELIRTNGELAAIEWLTGRTP